MTKRTKKTGPAIAKAKPATTARRIEVFTLRISDDERERLEGVAELSGSSAADVMRNAVNATCATLGVAPVFTN